jgi:hypothetical protein
MAGRLGFRDAWQYEVAAMLSQIGCVTLSPDVLEKVYSSVPLSESEAEAFKSQYEVAGRLLARIPRLEQTAQMVGSQQNPTTHAVTANPADLGCVDTGVELLQIASEFDQRLIRGLTRDEALSEIRARQKHNLSLIATLQTAEVPEFEAQARMIEVRDLRFGMVLNCEVRAKNGLLLFGKGQEVTEALIERLKNFAVSMGVVQPFSVILPRASAREAKWVS